MRPPQGKGSRSYAKLPKPPEATPPAEHAEPPPRKPAKRPRARKPAAAPPGARGSDGSRVRVAAWLLLAVAAACLGSGAMLALLEARAAPPAPTARAAPAGARHAPLLTPPAPRSSRGEARPSSPSSPSSPSPPSSLAAARGSPHQPPLAPLRPRACEEWCATHRSAWAVKCANFRSCGGCAQCSAPSSPPPAALHLPPAVAPPAPPPASPSARQLIERLNHRFDHGHPTNDMAAAGVLVRQFDHLSAWDIGEPWLPCPENLWCGRYRFSWPSTIINAQSRKVYYHAGQQRGGLVLALTARVLCVYPGDGNSMGNADNGLAGCIATQCNQFQDWNCVFPPDYLKEALEAQQRRGNRKEHNEVVLDVSSISPSFLPHSILAFFHMGDIGVVRGLQQKFIRAYGLEDWECPLLALNLYDSSRPAFSLETK
ncbi:hypothetical protein AB1Y20_012526 [Prymnesium parvum]|uniref:Uncharacterized protein n=1 Tax=Prymnesium parvum TaxID=97485 RepID=A0AB34IKT3_PRYPA